MSIMYRLAISLYTAHRILAIRPLHTVCFRPLKRKANEDE